MRKVKTNIVIILTVTLLMLCSSCLISTKAAEIDDAIKSYNETVEKELRVKVKNSVMAYTVRYTLEFTTPAQQTNEDRLRVFAYMNNNVEYSGGFAIVFDEYMELQCGWIKSLPTSDKDKYDALVEIYEYCDLSPIGEFERNVAVRLSIDDPELIQQSMEEYKDANFTILPYPHTE